MCAQKKYLRFEHLKEEDGLSNYYASDLLQDANGFLWIATSNGLNRYDGYNFRKWYHSSADQGSLLDSKINVLALDQKQRLWVGTLQGLNRFDPASEGFESFYQAGDGSMGPLNTAVRALLCDRKGRIWVGTHFGLGLLGSDSGNLIHAWTPSSSLSGLPSRSISCILEDGNGTIWVGTHNGLVRYREEDASFQNIEINSVNTGRPGQNQVLALCEDDKGLCIGTGDGLRHLDLKSGTLESITSEGAEQHGFNGRSVFSILFDDEKRMWLATDYNGIFLREREGERFQNYTYNPGDGHSLNSNQITRLYKDRDGAIWFCSMASGIGYFFPQALALGCYRNEINDPNSFPAKDTWTFAADGTKSLWIGTNQGLVHWDLEAAKFSEWLPNGEMPDDIPSNRVRAILPDDGFLWIGVHDGLQRFDLSSERFHTVPQNPDLPAITQVRAIVRTKQGKIWVGSFKDGLFQIDDQGKAVRNLRAAGTEPLIVNNKVRSLFEDARGNLWVGTSKGFSLIDATGKRATQFFQRDPTNPNAHYEIMCIHPGKGEAIWVGTHDTGLLYFDQEQGELRFLTTANGLPGNLIYGILGTEPVLWLATDAGLVRYNSESGEMRTFDTSDGTQGLDHNSGAYFAAPDGALLVGGANGLNRFFPADLNKPPQTPITILTGMRINNIEVSHADGDRPIYMSKKVVLDHKQNVISLDFALQSHYQTRKNQFVYRLEGFDADWIHVSQGRHSVTYTNLPPQDYVFRVKGNNGRGIWDPKGVALQIHKRSAPWRSLPAFALYLVTLTALLLWYLRHQRRKFAREREIVDRLRQVDKLRDDFLANTGHELRTPLNGIIGLAEALRDGSGPLEEGTRDSLELIISISQRLSALVNGILDFSQLRSNNLQLVKSEVDLHPLVEVVLNLSAVTLGDKPLRLINHVDPKHARVLADEGRLMQVLHNLIGNAVKFTHEGEVEVSSELAEGEVIVHVRDTGIGISAEKKEIIFQSFRQADEDVARQYGGTGLGLAISRELIQLHGGRCWVASEPGQGSTFSFSLPREMKEAASRPEPRAEAVVQTQPKASTPKDCVEPKGQPVGRSFRVLVVDDEPINCTVLKNHLLRHEVTVAHDGEYCLELLRSQKFDLVLLDIMMPRLSGYEVCRTIRKTASAAELPVIFLSARNLINDLTLGFDCGANDYITKPITKAELLSRVNIQLDLLTSHRDLEARIAARTRELEEKNSEILRTQKQLITQEKMANLGALTTGIAHEIRNPLNFVHGLALASKEQFAELEEALNLLDQDPKARDLLHETVADLRRNLDVILKHGRRANNIVETMMTLSRGGGGTRTRLRLAPLLESQTLMVYRDMRRKGETAALDIETQFADGEREVEANPREMGRVFSNLARNAIEAMVVVGGEGGRAPKLVLSARCENGQLILGMEDNGCGMTAEQQARACEPFVTSKSPDSQHIGLGLTLCYDIVTQEHGGELIIDSMPGKGTKIEIRLPL